MPYAQQCEWGEGGIENCWFINLHCPKLFSEQKGKKKRGTTKAAPGGSDGEEGNTGGGENFIVKEDNDSGNWVRNIITSYNTMLCRNFDFETFKKNSLAQPCYNAC